MLAEIHSIETGLREVTEMITMSGRDGRRSSNLFMLSAGLQPTVDFNDPGFDLENKPFADYMRFYATYCDGECPQNQREILEER
jgi:hypothetical protein